MKKFTYWSIDHPKWTLLLAGMVTLVFLIQFPKTIIDTDPENMLEADQPERVFYDQVKKDFGIDVREAYLTLTSKRFDLRLGRQIITWGTGDLVFITDVFPKDWTALLYGSRLEETFSVAQSVIPF